MLRRRVRDWGAGLSKACAPTPGLFLKGGGTMKRATLLLVYLLLGSCLNMGLIGFYRPVSAENFVFYDDFNDKGLDTTKWIEDVVGSGNSYRGENGEAEFVIFGHGGWEKGHSALVSRWIELGSWKSITISGRWKFTDPHTAEMVMGIDGPAKGQHLWVHYVSWNGPKITYKYGNTSKSEPREIPKHYVPFKLVVYPGRFEFWESGKLVTTVQTDCMGKAERIRLTIGGWDASPLVSHVYFDDIGVSYEPVTTSNPGETTTTTTDSSNETTAISSSPTSPATVSETGSASSGKGICGPGITLLISIITATFWRRRK